VKESEQDASAFAVGREPAGRRPRGRLRGGWVAFLLAVAAAMAAAVVIGVILPGYRSPQSRFSTSRFGYPSMLRRFSVPFTVHTARLTHRRIGHTALGEGLMRTEPFVVPVVPMGRIESVFVAVGDRVKQGQLIAKVDSAKAAIKVEAARAAMQTAKAELARVQIGSAYVLDKERPERDKIRLDAAEREAEVRAELVDMFQGLSEKKAASRFDYLQQKIAQIELEAKLNEARFNLGMSTRGVHESEAIAASAIREAELAIEHRLLELRDHDVHAIADGVIERCLVREGEYNQDPGKPGFLITGGSWFEANFDQTSFGDFAAGHRALVRLEARPGEALAGTVEYIEPFVKYDLGGPESTRPIRPLGTGAPEWPATFAVRVRLEQENPHVLPGMTGFCIVESTSEAACLPRTAVASVTAVRGIVYIVRDGGFEPREVELGTIDGDWIQIRGGLAEDETVIKDGWQVLEPGDRITIKEVEEEALRSDDRKVDGDAGGKADAKADG